MFVPLNAICIGHRFSVETSIIYWYIVYYQQSLCMKKKTVSPKCTSKLSHRKIRIKKTPSSQNRANETKSRSDEGDNRFPRLSSFPYILSRGCRRYYSLHGCTATRISRETLREIVFSPLLYIIELRV